MSATIDIPFAIGEIAWVCGPGRHEKRITCPECAGTCVIEMVKGNGEHVALQCNYCQSGYDPPRGWVNELQFAFEPMQFTPTKVRVDYDEFSYSNEAWHFYAKDMWRTREEAEVACIIKRNEHTANEERREIANLESKRRSLAFSSHYWKRQVTDLERSLIAARKRLAACKEKP